MDSLIGRTLGSYQILQELGKGGMATVYKAIQPSLNRYVALKILPPYFAHDDEFVRRFRFEAEAAARLKHSNIVTIYDVGVQEGIYYIAQEFVEGDTLAELIRREGSLAPSRAIAILRQIGSALDYAHALGFVHRDVKSSNIIVGSHDHATLTDFGIVRAMEGTRATKSGVMVGTPEYMAPEQIHGQAVDGRADIYALGIVAYEMLSGRVPFQGDTARVLHAQVYETPAALRSINPRLSHSLQSAITRALAKDPAQRFPHAADFVNALEAAAGAPVTRTMERKQPRESAIPKRNTFLILASAAVLTLLVLFVALMLNRAGQPTNVALSGATLPPVTMNIGIMATPFVVPVAVNTVAPTWTQTSTYTNTPQPSLTPTQTSTPLPTRTFTRTRTSTHTPTRTLTRTRTPTRVPTRTPTAIGASILNVKRVIRSTSFDNPSQDRFRAYGYSAKVSEGVVTLIGRETLAAQNSSYLVALFSAVPDSATVIVFRIDGYENSSFSVSWGDWGNSNYRGLHLGKANWGVYSGIVRDNDSYPTAFPSSLELKNNVWYVAMLRIRPQGLVQGMVWERDNPEIISKLSYEVNQEWVSHTFHFLAGANDGKIEISDYQELELNE